MAFGYIFPKSPSEEGQISTRQPSHSGPSPELLAQWSCSPSRRSLPPVESIREIHIYDFDNTLFKTPMPNRALWTDRIYGLLQSPDIFLDDGWWHNPSILEATGLGIDVEEGRAWEGWWNEKIVELARMSIEEEDVLAILLTGRKESRFADIVCRMAKSRGLEFDMVCLKKDKGPAGEIFKTTMAFKQMLIDDTLETYLEATEVRIYEDRIKHGENFRVFLDNYNAKIFSLHGSESGQPKRTKSIAHTVIMVADLSSTLEPVKEAALIQKMVNDHNRKLMELDEEGEVLPQSVVSPGRVKGWKLDKQVIMTYYAISPSDSAALAKTLVPHLTPGDSTRAGKLSILANRIVASFGTMQPDKLKKAGGLNQTVRFTVSEIGCLPSQGEPGPARIWAARVMPADPAQYVWIAPQHFARGAPRAPGTPTLVLAIRSGDTRLGDVKQISNWAPVTGDRIMFDGVLKESLRLNLEEVDILGEGQDTEADRAESDGGKRKHSNVSPRLNFAPQRPRGNSGGGFEGRRGPASGRYPSSQRSRGRPYEGGGPPRGGYHQAGDWRSASASGQRDYSPGRGGGRGRGGRGGGRAGRGGYRGRGGGGGYQDLDAVPNF